MFPLNIIVQRSGQAKQTNVVHWLESICTGLEQIASDTAAAIPGGMLPFTNMSFTGAMIAAGQCQVSEGSYHTAAGYCSQYDTGSCKGAWPTSLPPSYDVTVISVNYHADWFSQDGQHFLEHLRHAADAQSTDTVKWYTQGRAYDEYDSARITFDKMIYMLFAMVSCAPPPACACRTRA